MPRGWDRGVGSAIAASLAADGVASISLCDTNAASADGLAARLRKHYPRLGVDTRSNDPAGYELVVNATPLGMKAGDPLPVVATRLARRPFDVRRLVMKQQITPLLQAAQDRGCRFQVGTDMLFEMIPAYLEFFGFGTTTPEELRAMAKVAYQELCFQWQGRKVDGTRHGDRNPRHRAVRQPL